MNLFLLLACAQAAPTVTVIADGLTWLENLVLDPSSKSLFMSELVMGRVWRVQMQADGTYARSLWLSNFTEILGLTKDTNKPGLIYGVGSINSENVVFRASSYEANNFTVFATTPENHVGNGFGCHYATGKLYTASEGNFLPGTGSVYEIDPDTGIVYFFVSMSLFLSPNFCRRRYHHYKLAVGRRRLVD
jgi:hypothetical protein